VGVYDVTADVTGSVVLIELLADYCKAVVDFRSALVHRPFGVSSSVQGFTDAKGTALNPILDQRLLGSTAEVPDQTLSWLC